MESIVSYELLRDDDYYINLFRLSVNELLWFIKSTPVNLKGGDLDKHKKFLSICAEYLQNLYAWLDALLDTKGSFVKNINFVYYDELRQIFGLTEFAKFEPTKGVQDIRQWSHPYWKFLHLGSICTYIKMKQTATTSNVLDLFGAVLINLYLILLCANCSVNFRQKDVNKNIVEPMLLDRDPIYNVYRLHNMVTESVTGAPATFTFEDFEFVYAVKKILPTTTTAAAAATVEEVPSVTKNDEKFYNVMKLKKERDALAQNRQMMQQESFKSKKLITQQQQQLREQQQQLREQQQQLLKLQQRRQQQMYLHNNNNNNNDDDDDDDVPSKSKRPKLEDESKDIKNDLLKLQQRQQQMYLHNNNNNNNDDDDDDDDDVSSKSKRPKLEDESKDIKNDVDSTAAAAAIENDDPLVDEVVSNAPPTKVKEILFDLDWIKK